MVEHCRDTLRLGSVRNSAVGHCRDTRQFGTGGMLCGWALQGYVVVGHCRDTWWLGTAGILGGWSLKSASSRARTTSTLKSNNPTAREGNNSKNQEGLVGSRNMSVHASFIRF